MSKLNITKHETVQNMVDSLIEKAEEIGVDLSELDYSGSYGKTVNSIDDLMDQTGEIRCENFCDLAWEYAGQFGEFAGDKFEGKRWECTEAAVKELKRRFCK